jgi:hypothetical protein
MSPEDLTENAQAAPPETGAPQADGPDQPDAATAPRKKRSLPAIDADNILLAGLFVGAIAALWLLSTRTKPQTASAEQQTVEAQVDAALLQLRPGARNDDSRTRAIVDTFYYEAAQRQLPSDALPAAPFTYAPEQDVPGQAEHSERNRKQQAAARAMQAIRQLELQSVLRGGGEAKAMISNNLLGEGETINGWTVRKIRESYVELGWKDQTHILNLPR